MIKITENAQHQLEKLLALKPEVAEGLRLTVKTTGCSGNSYTMEYIKAGEDMAADDVIEAGAARLHIPKIHSWMLIGMTIDFVTDHLGNSKFEFINPNETGRCGCGESFNVGKPVGA